ncbi:MAG: asparagine synthase (glutamine-hydrolyzing) [Actinomycetota bacterium]
MCGISGYVDTAGAPPDEALVTRMSDLLSHRGPDGARVEVLAAGPEGPTVVVGHRRLAIIDLTEAAAQPLANEDGTVSVAYNGEIYNFRDLRRDLESRGHVFRSRSDTEVLVHAYEAFGDEFVARLDGMFAFALWDARRQRLVLARDRAGKKPLYYAWDGLRLAFASESRALRLCDWVDASVAWEVLPAFLALGYPPWPGTFYRGIRQVPPASFMVLEGGALSEPREYWALRFGGHGAKDGDRRAAWQQAGALIRHRLRNAVERRLVSDVPLGVLLSGGIDSSAIVALMADLGVRARTFTVGMADEASYDERRYARLVAEHFGTEHTEIEIRADAAALIQRLLWFVDQPFADSSAVPTYLIAKAAREHVKVVLTGDGGDEAFGGYERFAAALLADRMPIAAQRTLGVLAGVLPRSGSYHSLRRGLERFTGSPQLPAQDRYRAWISVFDDDALARVLSPDLLVEAERVDPFASFREECARAGDVPLLHRLIFANFRTYLHDDLLVKTDRMTMANSLEARSPLLDSALLEDLATLPPWMKASPFALKRVLRHALRDTLPATILRRRKHGFGVPVGRWFRHELREPFQELVLGPDARSAPALRQSAVDSLLRAHLSGNVDHGPKLWSLLTLELWLRLQERPAGDGPPPLPEVLVSGRGGP